MNKNRCKKTPISKISFHTALEILMANLLVFHHRLSGTEYFHYKPTISIALMVLIVKKLIVYLDIYSQATVVYRPKKTIHCRKSEPICAVNFIGANSRLE